MAVLRCTCRFMRDMVDGAGAGPAWLSCTHALLPPACPDTQCTGLHVQLELRRHANARRRMRQAQPTAQSTFSSPRCDVSEAIWGPTGTASAHLILIGTRARASPQDRLHQIHFSIFNLKWQTHTHLTAPHALCGAVWTSDGSHVLGWAVVSAGITEVDGPWVPEEHDRHRGPPRWARCGKVCFIQGEVLGVSLVEPGAARALVNPALEGRTICTPATQLCPLPELAAPSITSDQAAVHPSKDSADSAEALQDASPRLSAMHAGGPELEADTQDEESIGGSEAPWKFVFGHAAAPSPCGRYLVAVKSCYDLMRLGFLVQRPAELQNVPETYRALDAPSWRLVHYDLAAQELHCLLAGLPNPRTRCEEISEFDPFVRAAWQPWPQASLLYAWASAQGPAFLVDCHQHCVLARLSLDGDPPCLRIQPRSQLGTLDGVCYDEELGKLPGSTMAAPWAWPYLVMQLCPILAPVSIPGFKRQMPSLEDPL
ncbi:hypothetical protein WJX84_001991 [Apatococcus fuscideae]|uniref:Uncharacterized protein n=1 Tax=Apatococcus fuscideae TaxID=2026836 RepID=A0AAW1SP88_9CHLO